MPLKFQVILKHILSRKSRVISSDGKFVQKPNEHRPMGNKYSLFCLHRRTWHPCTIIKGQENKLVTFCYQQCGSGIAIEQFLIRLLTVQTRHLASIFHTSTKQSTFFGTACKSFENRNTN